LTLFAPKSKTRRPPVRLKDNLMPEIPEEVFDKDGNEGYDSTDSERIEPVNLVCQLIEDLESRLNCSLSIIEINLK